MGLAMKQKDLKEDKLSLRAIILGALLSIVMGAANVYLGLKVGMTIAASIPAAVVAALILRGLLKNGTIFESNQVQTAASAGEALAGGIIFTVPAFLMIGFWSLFDFWTTTLIAIAGGILGTLFMIPMRKVFIVGDFKDLPYPEAKAAASVLITTHSVDESAKIQAWSLVYGTLIGGVIQFLIGFLGLIKNVMEAATTAFNRVFYFGCDVSPALLGIGFIVGLNISCQVFLGGVIGWVILLPLLSAGTSLDGDPLSIAWTLWSTKIRYIGVGALVIGGCASIYFARMGFIKAFSEIKEMAKRTGLSDDKDRDISAKTIIIFATICIATLIFVYYRFTHSIGVTAIASITMVILAFFFTAVANYIVAIVGNSNSPLSGMSITTVLISGLLLLVFGFSGVSGMAASLGVAAVICCASSVAGDACNDLKTGHLINASPFRQQIMQIIGVVVSAFSMAPVLKLLHENTPGGIGGRELAAPQASLLSSLVKGLFAANGSLPWQLIGLGLVIGFLILLAEFIVRYFNLNFKIHVMPVAIGIYLPFELTIPILLGGLFNWLIARKYPKNEQEEKTRRGVLFSSGFIAGESLMGVAIALLASLGIKRLDLGLTEPLLSWFTIIGFLLMLLIFVLQVRRTRDIS
jgi:putative OPT family oligopeptide transporter